MKDRETELKNMTDVEYLNTPELISIRSRLFAKYRYRCSRCGEYRPLQICPIREKLRGTETDNDFTVLCVNCRCVIYGE